MSSSWNRLLWSLSAPLRWFLAADVFVSYRSQDCAGYAERLCESLGQGGWWKRLRCVTDRREALSGEAGVPSAVKRAARWARLRVVVVSPASLDSDGMLEELVHAMRRPRPRALLVVFPGTGGVADPAPEQAVWFHLTADVRRVMDHRIDWDPNAKAEPGTEVVQAIRSTCDFLLQNARTALAAAVALCVVAGTSGLLAWQTGELTKAQNQTRDERQAARRARDAASAARAQASAAERAAEVAERRASEASVAAKALRDAGEAIVIAQAPSQAPRAVRKAIDSLHGMWNPVAADLLRGLVITSPPLLVDLQPACNARHVGIDRERRRVAMGIGGSLCLVDVRSGVVQAVSLPDADRFGIGALAFDGRGVLWVFPGMTTPLAGARLHRFRAEAGGRWSAMPSEPLPFHVFGAWPSRAGDRLAVAAGDGVPERLVVMQATGAGPPAMTTLGAPGGRHVSHVAFSADDRLLVAGVDRAYEVWSSWDAAPAPAGPASVLPRQFDVAPVFAVGRHRMAAQEERGKVVVRSLPGLERSFEIEAAAEDIAISRSDALTVVDATGQVRSAPRALVDAGAVPAPRRSDLYSQGRLIAVSDDDRCRFLPTGGIDSLETEIHGLLGAGLTDTLRLGLRSGDVWLATLGPGCSLLAVGHGQVRLWGELGAEHRPAAAFGLYFAEAAGDAGFRRLLVREGVGRAQQVRFVSEGDWESAVQVDFGEAVLATRLNATGLPEVATSGALHSARRWPPRGPGDFDVRPWQLRHAMGGSVTAALAPQAATYAYGASTRELVVAGPRGARTLAWPGPDRHVGALWVDPAATLLGLRTGAGRSWEFRALSADGPGEAVLRVAGNRAWRPLGSRQFLWVHDELRAPPDTVSSFVVKFDIASGLRTAAWPIADGDQLLCADARGDAVALTTRDGYVDVVSSPAAHVLQRIARIPVAGRVTACSFDVAGEVLTVLSSAGLLQVPLGAQALLARAQARAQPQPQR